MSQSRRPWRVVVRVDASPTIGIGHVMRCLSLADSLGSRGAQVTFVSRHLPLHLSELIARSGHHSRVLRRPPSGNDAVPLSHASWLGTSQAADAEELAEVFATSPPAWVVVDHYALDYRWQNSFGACVGRTLVIDDLADRRHICDVLLDQNLYPDMASRYHGLLPSTCRQLLGPKYALLRPTFARRRQEMPQRTGEIRRIMVLLGGMDTPNHTGKVLRALATLKRGRWSVDVVIGAQHPDPDGIARLCESCGFQLHVQTDDVADLMCVADLAIGAAGSTSWERCALGLPAVCLTYAANQEPIAEGLAAAGAIINLGDGLGVTGAELAEVVASLMTKPAVVRDMSNAAWDLVDGLGADRVATVMEGLRA